MRFRLIFVCLLALAAANTFARPALLIATHYTGLVFAPSMWSNLDLARAIRDFAHMRGDGFNTVILIVPWTGFQPQISPLQYRADYFDRLDELFKAAETAGLDVILRLGYEHDLSGPDHPDHHERVQRMGRRDTIEWAAWQDYLKTLHDRASRHRNFRYGFISWEDFFLLHAQGATPAQRMVLADELGYQHYLHKYTIAELSRIYNQSFTAHEEIPVPRPDEPASRLFNGFWDEWLLQLLRDSRVNFPELELEVRIDCESMKSPQSSGYICHENTYSLGSGGMPQIYFNPAWGADNLGDHASSQTVLDRLQYLLKQLKTRNPQRPFIDQFNFVDNTPGFEHNTRLADDQVDAFLLGAAPVLRAGTRGYGLWTLRDLPGNVLPNGAFEQGASGWELQHARIETIPSGGQRLAIDEGGSAIHVLQPSGWLAKPDSPPYHVRLQAVSRHLDATLQLRLLTAGGNERYTRTLPVPSNQDITLDYPQIPPPHAGERLELLAHGPVTIDDVMLYNLVQENGIYDINGKPRPFAAALRQLNATLTASTPPASVGSENTQHAFGELSADGWVQQAIEGRLRADREASRLQIELYVPEHWSTYRNTCEIRIEGQPAGSYALHAGLNVLELPLRRPLRPGDDLEFTLVPAHTYQPRKFDPTSTDQRELAFRLHGATLKN